MSAPALTPEMIARSGESKFSTILAILLVGGTLSTTVVVLRLITRFYIIRTAGLDDYFIGVAQILAIGAGVVIGMEAKYGMGKHVWVVPPEDLVPYFKSLYASILVYNGALTVVKISILLQYRRIFTTPGMQRATKIGLLIICAWGVTVILMLSMICVPIVKFWDQPHPGHCLPLLPAYYAPACINIVTDFGTWILPLPIIKSLQLPRRQRFMLMFIFGLGFFTCIISLVRLSALKTATGLSDPTWNNTDAATWSYLELSIAILAACLPTLRPLAIKFVPGFISSPSEQSPPNSNGYVRQGPERHSAWVSAKFSNNTDTKGTVSTQTESTDNLHEPMYNLQSLPSHKIAVEREYIVRTASAGVPGR
ncbi:hypothetical protein L207DRAFT_639887 [Hyaloscypha variabilis F]|uniref:Rhodopsin domain-containing protein n=1 Tax=Hyaloscypha variabilis (strain UAMH 11265 / GT02V1 / F) TaxID=1149755 RepID=A0A2J6R249_HYAVF|nr:hypothetical protein L207DRAFT_639887 [Hyaloscypha variabilis F]